MLPDAYIGRTGYGISVRQTPAHQGLLAELSEAFCHERSKAIKAGSHVVSLSYLAMGMPSEARPKSSYPPAPTNPASELNRSSRSMPKLNNAPPPMPAQATEPASNQPTSQPGPGLIKKTKKQ